MNDKPPRQPLSFDQTAFAVMLGVLLAEAIGVALYFLFGFLAAAIR